MLRAWHNREMDIRIEEIEAQQVAGIRTEAAQTEIADKVVQLLGEIMPQFGAQMAGAPLAVYHRWEGDRGEMEVVSAPVRRAALLGQLADSLDGGRRLLDEGSVRGFLCGTGGQVGQFLGFGLGQ